MCLALQSRKFTLRVMRVLWFDYPCRCADRAEAKAQMSRDAVLSFKLIHAESANWIDELSAAGTVPSGFGCGTRSELVRFTCEIDQYYAMIN